MPFTVWPSWNGGGIRSVRWFSGTRAGAAGAGFARDAAGLAAATCAGAPVATLEILTLTVLLKSLAPGRAPLAASRYATTLVYWASLRLAGAPTGIDTAMNL